MGGHAEIRHGSAAGNKFGNLDFHGWIGFFRIRLEVRIKPDISFRTGDKVDSRFVTVHDKGIVGVSGAERHRFRRAFDRFVDKPFRDFDDPVRGVTLFNR